MPGEVVKVAGAGAVGSEVEQQAQSPGKTGAASYPWLSRVRMQAKCLQIVQLFKRTGDFGFYVSSNLPTFKWWQLFQVLLSPL